MKPIKVNMADASFTQGISTESAQMLQEFWPKIAEDIRTLKNDHFRTQTLPLARIKKIMKLDEDVRMISAEAPVLFSKACEIFIMELSLRAWIHTEDNKRRTLQRNDIAMAISKFDQFDFLIDIVPREDIKPAKRQDETRTSVLPEQIQYYLQLAQQQAQQSQQQQQTSQATAVVPTPTTLVSQPMPQASIQQIQLAGQTVTQAVAGSQIQLPGGQIIQQPFPVAQTQVSAASSQPQVISIQQPAQQAVTVPQQAPAQTVQVQQASQAQPQVFQQVISQSGQVENVPIHLSPEQLQMIQLQLQGKTGNQPIIIQTSSANTGAVQTQPDATQQFSRQGVVQVPQLHGQTVYLQQDENQSDS